MSEAQKKDLEKRNALKEAKKQWDGVQQVEESRKVLISNQINVTDKILDFSVDLESRRVVALKGNEGCSYTFPEHLSLIKIFIESCKNCTIQLDCSIKTSHVDVSHCENVTLIIGKQVIHTIQVDISTNVSILYKKGLFNDQCKLYHSYVRSLKVDYDQEEADAENRKYLEIDDFELSRTYNPQFPEHHHQYVTTFLNNDFITDLVLRDASGHPTTNREIEERRKAIESVVLERGLDINSVEVQKALHEYDPASPQQLGRIYKDEGNKAFKECDYGQAAVHYTQAIESFELVSVELDHQSKELLCAALSNRAACSLKLGDHENALADSEACLKIDPNHIKAIFRKGLALHAMGRYREACPVLGKAASMKPKDKEIQAALLFAERKASLQR